MVPARSRPPLDAVRARTGESPHRSRALSARPTRSASFARRRAQPTETRPGETTPPGPAPGRLGRSGTSFPGPYAEGARMSLGPVSPLSPGVPFARPRRRAVAPPRAACIPTAAHGQSSFHPWARPMNSSAIARSSPHPRRSFAGIPRSVFSTRVPSGRKQSHGGARDIRAARDTARRDLLAAAHAVLPHPPPHISARYDVQATSRARGLFSRRGITFLARVKMYWRLRRYSSGYRDLRMSARLHGPPARARRPTATGPSTRPSIPWPTGAMEIHTAPRRHHRGKYGTFLAYAHGRRGHWAGGDAPDPRPRPDSCDKPKSPRRQACS